MTKKARTKTETTETPKPKKSSNERKKAVVPATPPANTEILTDATAPVAIPAAAEALATPPRENNDAVPEAAAPKLSALAAAAKVLQEAGKPLNCQEMIGQMASKGYWTTPGGKTPASTLYSAILRELHVKKDQSRFRKVTKGHFEHTSVA